MNEAMSNSDRRIISVAVNYPVREDLDCRRVIGGSDRGGKLVNRLWARHAQSGRGQSNAFKAAVGDSAKCAVDIEYREFDARRASVNRQKVSIRCRHEYPCASGARFRFVDWADYWHEPLVRQDQVHGVRNPNERNPDAAELSSARTGDAPPIRSGRGRNGSSWWMGRSEPSSGRNVGRRLPLGYFPNDARPGDTALVAAESIGKSS
jgi:hypothetical protein